MRIKIMKCKNCNDVFLKGRSDKKFCHKKCRFQYHYKNKTPKDLVNKNKETFEQVISDLDYFKTYFRFNSDEVKRQFENTNNDSNDDLDLQMELLKRSDNLSRLRRIEKCVLLNTKK